MLAGYFVRNAANHMKKAVRLILAQGDDVLRDVSLDEGSVKIGRGLSNDLVIDHPAISGEHAIIVVSQGEVCVEDLNSTNGTKVNGQPIQKHFLLEVDVIELAHYTLRHVIEQVEYSSPKLRLLSGPLAGHEVMLTQVLTTIGLPGAVEAVVAQIGGAFYFCRIQEPSHLHFSCAALSEYGQKLEYGDEFVVAEARFSFMPGK